MTNTDPAIEAARRWWAKQGDTEQDREDSIDCWSDVAHGAAREALAPIHRILDDYEGDPVTPSKQSAPTSKETRREHSRCGGRHMT